MKVNKYKVDKTYKSVLNHMRKEIKKLRQDLGFSQTMLAERIGASPSHNSKWENNRNKISQGSTHKI